MEIDDRDLREGPLSPDFDVDPELDSEVDDCDEDDDVDFEAIWREVMKEFARLAHRAHLRAQEGGERADS